MDAREKAEHAEARVPLATTEAEREYWLRRASYWWLRAPMPITTKVRQLNIEGADND